VEPAAILAASAGFIGLLAVVEILSRHPRVTAELARKLAHLSCGVLAAFMPLFMTFRSVIVVAVLFIPFMVVSRKLGIFASVHRAERTTLGEVYFPLGVGLAAALFPATVPYTFGVLVMAVSDALAALAGGRWGRRGYSILGAHKTFTGSTVFFVSTAVLATGILAVSGRLHAGSMAAALAAALILTALEGVLAGGVDNAVLPAAAAGLIVAFT
jgi:phytol kinase